MWFVAVQELQISFIRIFLYIGKCTPYLYEAFVLYNYWLTTLYMVVTLPVQMSLKSSQLSRMFVQM